MVVNIPDNGLLLESSAKVMAGLPTQAFAITLSDSVIEDMIKCVQDGGELQLSLGNSPVSGSSPSFHLASGDQTAEMHYCGCYCANLLHSQRMGSNYHNSCATTSKSIKNMFLYGGCVASLSGGLKHVLLVFLFFSDSNRLLSSHCFSATKHSRFPIRPIPSNTTSFNRTQLPRHS